MKNKKIVVRFFVLVFALATFIVLLLLFANVNLSSAKFTQEIVIEGCYMITTTSTKPVDETTLEALPSENGSDRVVPSNPVSPPDVGTETTVPDETGDSDSSKETLQDNENTSSSVDESTSSDNKAETGSAAAAPPPPSSASESNPANEPAASEGQN